MFRKISLSLLLDLRQIALSRTRIKIQTEEGSQSTPEIYPLYLVKRTIYYLFQGQRLCGPQGKVIESL